MGLMKICSYRVECDFHKIAENTKYNCLHTQDVADINFKDALRQVKGGYKKIGEYWICYNCIDFAKENNIAITTN